MFTSLLQRQSCSIRSFYSSTASHKTADPLRVLFCGSDEFSIASLRALHAHKNQQPQSVASIDVVHRPGKRTGRGLKKIREVPIKHVAEELELRTHEIDTFTGWTPPCPPNLVVAVSFGLLVPPRILNAAKYGGLNVHPSLLPDLRGPAPIHHTLLKQRERTGITVQTLHPKQFDQGMILAQTPYPGLAVPDNSTPSQLLDMLTPVGAKMLVDVIKNGAYIPPLKKAGWYPSSDSDSLDHAEKITKEHHRVDWKRSRIDDLLLRHRVLGDLWCTMPIESVRDGQKVIVEKRVVIHGLEEHIPERSLSEYGDNPGFFVEDTVPMQKLASADLLALTSDFRDLETEARNAVLRITSCTVDGGKKGQGRMEILRSLKVG
ncbi:Formyltransferase [Delitschia confertaspora ATCC 74209]|uniref:methionyl-tRNA formyltransferase n=1 Tax=Delitschia confertaspora ATCC 74209 TaxID=1513339 RepID=A0A9P4MQ85_9PLEO|nr:Formyltransferase [Delitschia confertaspora ATCC 74209]